MILLRRGRPAPAVVTTLEIDTAFDLGPTVGQRRDCVAPWRPPVEVFETKRELVVRAEIGGLSASDVSVVVDGETLYIRGERSIANAPDHRLFHESRIRYGPFEAAIRLPFPVDVLAAGADYIDGFLTVRLPRRAAVHIPAGASGGADGPESGGR